MAILLITAAVEVLTLVLWARSRRQIAALLLAAGTLPVLWTLALDLRHPERIGAATVNSDLRFFGFELAIAVFALVSLYKPAWLCFWAGWLANLFMVAIYLYLAFVWHPFG